MELTAKHREILTHSLGISERNPLGYRNYFAAVAAGESREACNELTKGGLMWERPNPEAYTYFHVTEQGAAAIGVKLPKDD